MLRKTFLCLIAVFLLLSLTACDISFLKILLKRENTSSPNKELREIPSSNAATSHSQKSDSSAFLEFLPQKDDVTSLNANLNGTWGSITISGYSPECGSFKIGWNGSSADTTVYLTSTMDYSNIGEITFIYETSDKSIRTSINFRDDDIKQAATIYIYTRSQSENRFIYITHETIDYKNIPVFQESIEKETTKSLSLSDLNLVGTWGIEGFGDTVKITEHNENGLQLSWYNLDTQKWTYSQSFNPSSTPYFMEEHDAYWFQASSWYVRIVFADYGLHLAIWESAGTPTCWQSCYIPIDEARKD